VTNGLCIGFTDIFRGVPSRTNQRTVPVDADDGEAFDTEDVGVDSDDESRMVARYKDAKQQKKKDKKLHQMIGDVEVLVV